MHDEAKSSGSLNNLNITGTYIDDVGKKNLMHTVADNKVKVVNTHSGGNPNLNSVLHRMQISRGCCFVHVYEVGMISQNSAAVIQRLSTITYERRMRHDGNCIDCLIPLRPHKIAELKVKEGLKSKLK